MTRGSGSNSEEIATTHHAHKAVVYPSRQWSAQRAGLYTVCVSALTAPHRTQSPTTATRSPSAETPRPSRTPAPVFGDVP